MNVAERSESRFSPPRPGVEHPEWWHSQDEQATEDEVLEGIHGLIRLLQPEYCVETGTHLGDGAAMIGQALKDNGHGELDTIESDANKVSLARSIVAGLPVVVHHGDAREFKPRRPIDFAFFDSSADPGHRKAEFIRFYGHMHHSTIVAFHDTFVDKETISVVTSDVLELANENFLVPIFLPTPRGLALCRVKK